MLDGKHFNNLMFNKLHDLNVLDLNKPNAILWDLLTNWIWHMIENTVHTQG